MQRIFRSCGVVAVRGVIASSATGRENGHF
jgi:hypothetical protein